MNILHVSLNGWRQHLNRTDLDVGAIHFTKRARYSSQRRHDIHVGVLRGGSLCCVPYHQVSIWRAPRSLGVPPHQLAASGSLDLPYSLTLSSLRDFEVSFLLTFPRI